MHRGGSIAKTRLESADRRLLYSTRIPIPIDLFIITLGTVGEEPSIGSLLLTVVTHLPLFRPLHTKAFLQKLRARRALLRELRGRIR